MKTSSDAPIPAWQSSAFALLILLSLIIRLPTFTTLPEGFLNPASNNPEEIQYHHIENDEVIYQTLIEQVNGNFFNYSLKDTRILKILDARVFGNPIFAHPPVFVYTSWLVTRVLRLPYPMIPVIFSIATIFLGFWIAKTFYDREVALWTALFLTLCPVSWFLSQKFWIDSLLTFLVTAAVALFLKAAQKDTPRYFFLAGLGFSLAFLTKYTAVFVLPALLFLSGSLNAGLKSGKVKGKILRVSNFLAYLIPCLVLCGGWLLLAHSINGRLLTEIIEWDPVKYPFMKWVTQRPGYFYLEAFFLIFPVYLLAFSLPLKKLQKDQNVIQWMLLIWALTFFIGFTVVGLLHVGYQTRFIAPALPPLAILSGVALQKYRKKFWVLGLALLLLAYSTSMGYYYGVIERTNAAEFTETVFGYEF